MSLVSGEADILFPSDTKAAFTGDRIRKGMLGFTSDTFQIVKKDLVTGNYTFFSDDSKQMLLATDQEATGKKTFNAETLIKGTNTLFFNNITTGGQISHNGTELTLKNDFATSGHINIDATSGSIIHKTGGGTRLTILDARVELASSVDLKLGVAKTGSADVVSNGFITILDSTGATIHLMTRAPPP